MSSIAQKKTIQRSIQNNSYAKDDMRELGGLSKMNAAREEQAMTEEDMVTVFKHWDIHISLQDLGALYGCYLDMNRAGHIFRPDKAVNNGMYSPEVKLKRKMPPEVIKKLGNFPGTVRGKIVTERFHRGAVLKLSIAVDMVRKGKLRNGAVIERRDMSYGDFKYSEYGWR